MIALFLLLAAQAAPNTAAQQSCVRAAGSEIILCGTPPQSVEAPRPQNAATPLPQGSYRLLNLRPKAYGPPPSAQTNLGHGVRATLRGQSSNTGRGRRNKSTATLSVPF